MLNYHELRQQFRCTEIHALKGPKQALQWLFYWLLGVSMLIILACLTGCAMASMASSEPINIERLASAISKAENSKAHPYGIMAKYKHTSPRATCINTIKSALKRWEGQGDFIAFLSATYAPVGNIANDPRHLNNNWVKNVRYYYERD